MEPQASSSSNRTPAFGTGLLFLGLAIPSAAQGTATRPIESVDFGKVSLGFEANVGQCDDAVRFLTRGPGYAMFVTPAEVVLSFLTSDTGESDTEGSTTLRMRVVGGDPGAIVSGLSPQPGSSHYFKGRDPDKWLTGVPRFAKARVEEVYPGISMVLYGSHGQLEYDFIADPGADPARIRLGFAGQGCLEVTEEGDLLVSLPNGEELRSLAPLAYQEVDGRRERVEAAYALHDGDVVGFQIGRFDPRRPLVIDPVIVYSTFLGGSNFDQPLSIAIDSQGNAYVAGRTFSLDFPTVNPVPGTGATSPAGHPDAFVAKLDPTGSSLVYSTFLGSDGADIANDVAVHQGNAFVVGTTQSFPFPTTSGALQMFPSGLDDGFLVKLDATGQMVYGTYLGGLSVDSIASVAVDVQGLAHVTGRTISTNFPTTLNAFQRLLNNGDAFITRIAPNGSGAGDLVYSTYFGGAGGESGTCIATDASQNSYVAGDTNGGSQFPIQSAFQSQFGGGRDAFVCKLNGSGSLVFSSFLGGSDFDESTDIAIDSNGSPFVYGFTFSSDFPTSNFFGANGQFTPGGLKDAFITHVSASGSGVWYSLYLGGSGDDNPGRIAVEPVHGVAYVVGETFSQNFPTRNPIQIGHVADAYVTAIAYDGSFVYSTYLGGSLVDTGHGIAVDTAGRAYVCGDTGSTPPSFPVTPGAFQPTRTSPAGVGTGFVTKLQTPGVQFFGHSTPSCLGPIDIGVDGMPFGGYGLFRITCKNAPPSALGFLVLALAPVVSGTLVQGITVFLDPNPIHVSYAVTSDAAGNASFPLVLPAGYAGTHLFAQYIWVNTATCGGVDTLSASNALDVTVQ